jgi:mRNA (guanine-N7-)-methyltransferase
MSTIVTRSYDFLAEHDLSLEDRQNSKIIHLRLFNNWIKSVLIDRFCPQPNARVFDCACGRGGDIPKWKRKDVNSYVFGDISLEALKLACEKYSEVRSPSQAIFLRGNIFACDIVQWIPSGWDFHISSCQFALHYAFETEQLAGQAIGNLCQCLVPGGTVILTVVDACRLVKQFQSIPTETVIKSSICTIERHFDLDDIPIFGAKYRFLLEGAVEGAGASGVPEFLIHPEVLKTLFENYGCTLYETMSFHGFYHSMLLNYPGAKRLFIDLVMRQDLYNPDMTREEWDVISYYSYFVFRKGGDPVPMPSPEKALPGEAKDGEFRIIDIEKNKEVLVSVPRKTKDRESRRRSDQFK